MIYSFMTNASGSKFALKVAVVYLLVITIPPPKPNFFFFFIIRKIAILKITVFRVIGDFSAPNFDWLRGLLLSNHHFYLTLKGGAIYTSTCLLALTQFVSTDDALDPVFRNFSHVSTFFADVGDVKLDDSCLPPIVIEIPLDLHTCALYHEHSYRMFALGDYSLLFSFLSNYDCSCVLVITQQMLQ